MVHARLRMVLAPAVAALLAAACQGGDDPTVPTAPAATPSPGPAGTATTGPTETTPPVSPTDQAVAIAVDVQGGEVVGGVRTVEVPLGAPVELTVRTDVADEVHVHGYDLVAPVAPGEPATIRFVADLPGEYEVELEERHLPILTLQVR